DRVGKAPVPASLGHLAICAATDPATTCNGLHGCATDCHIGCPPTAPRAEHSTSCQHARQRVAGLAAARAQLVGGIHHRGGGRRVIAHDLIEQHGQLPVDAVQVALLHLVFDPLPAGTATGRLGGGL